MTTIRRIMASSSWAEMLAGMALGTLAAALVDRSLIETTIAIMLGVCGGRWVFGARRW